MTNDNQDALRRELEHFESIGYFLISDNAIAAHLRRLVAENEALRPALTPREIELLDGMIGVQLYHAAQCDSIQNRTMAERQKGWTMERVALLRKLGGTK